MPPSRRRGEDVQDGLLSASAAIAFRLGTALVLLLVLLDHPRANGMMSNAVDDWVGNSSAIVCNGIPGLTKEQRELCHPQPDVTVAAIKGLQMAIAECQHQFMWHRWNCSSLTPSMVTQHSSVILQRGYRETGFVYAIAAAGVAHSVSRACSMGWLLSCECDPSSYRASKVGKPIKGYRDPGTNAATAMGGGGTRDWKWGGCSHNLEFGMEFSRQFLDAREVAGDIQSTVNLHNNQAGRHAVASNMQLRCKCHGMTGSCVVKTCWKVVPDFRMVGRALKSRFRNAVAVAQSNFGNVMPLSRIRNGVRRSKKLGNRNKHRSSNSANSVNSVGSSNSAGSSTALASPKKPGKKHGSRSGHGGMKGQLFFFQKSPNFCERDPQSDIVGTSGRRCNRPSAGGDGCASLCCGRGYNVVRQRRIERCGCKFHWCCFVQCQNCTVEEWITVCK